MGTVFRGNKEKSKDITVITEDKFLEVAWCSKCHVNPE